MLSSSVWAKRKSPKFRYAFHPLMLSNGSGNGGGALALWNKRSALLFEGSVRIGLVLLFLYTEAAEPLDREIHSSGAWMYQYPRKSDYVPATILWFLLCLIIPLLCLCLLMLIPDFAMGSRYLRFAWGYSLALGLNGWITNLIKLIYGRPRPDFFWRCDPSGKLARTNFLPVGGILDIDCTNPLVGDVAEGRKSFPSGHSSFSFAALIFPALLIYRVACVRSSISGCSRGLGIFWASIPCALALAIALSRTADYHHHWEDVLAGSVLGTCIGAICFHAYFNLFGNNGEGENSQAGELRRGASQKELV